MLRSDNVIVIKKLAIVEHKFSRLFLFGLVAEFYILWMCAGGVSLVDALRTLISLSVQTAVGLTISLRLFGKQRYFTDSIALGVAVGSIVCTVIDQIFVGMGVQIPRPLWQICLLILFASDFLKNQQVLIPAPEFVDVRVVAASPLVVMFGYGLIPSYWYVSLMLTLVTTFLLFMPQVARSQARICLSTSFGLGLSLLSIFALRPNEPTYGIRLLRPLYIGTDDLVFSESVSWSLSHFGFHEYAASIGTSMRYHWFSLAWSGLIDKESDSLPFVVTLHVIPVVTFVTLAWLIIALFRACQMPTSFGIIACTILFSTSIGFDPSRFFHTLNTSNIVPFIWIVTALLALVATQSEVRNRLNLAIPFLVSVILVSKVPFGLSTLAGLGFGLLYTSSKKRRIGDLVILFSSVLISLVSYALFLRPHSWEQRKLMISPNLTSLNTGIINGNVIPTILVFGIFLTLVVGILGSRFADFLPSQRLLIISLSGMVISGILRFLLIGNSAELYFLNPAIFAGSLVSAIGLSQTLGPRSRRFKIYLIPLFVCSFAATLIRQNFELTRYLPSTQIRDSLFPLIVGSLAACVGGVLLWLLGIKLGRNLFLVFVTTSLASSGALFFALLTQHEQYTSTDRVAATKDLQALSWLRNSSPDNAIVVTNRYLCQEPSSCLYDDSSFLISAVGRRRVFVEGPRFVAGGRPYPDWITERVRTSIRFAESPTHQDLKSLQKMGVSWVFIDEEFLHSGSFDESKWFEFGKVRYRNQGIVIVELDSPKFAE